MGSKLEFRDGRYFVSAEEADLFIRATERNAGLTREELFARAARHGDDPHVAVELPCGCVYEIVRSPGPLGWKYEVERTRFSPDHQPSGFKS